MSKPIDKLDFWKERIDGAQREHYSVYICGEKMWQDIYDNHERIIGEVIPPDAKVLDAGCGYGRMSQLFSPEFYVGIDFSPDFIAKAKEKYPEYRFQQENLKAIPFKDKEFDWAFCVSIKRMVIDNLGQEEWDKMQEELTRVAKNVLILEYEDAPEYEIL